MPTSSPNDLVPQRQLNLFDAVCINVGIIIGAGIYQTTPFIASQVAGPGPLLGMWLLGGLIALLGALCYGELATAFPRHGGEYVYLTHLFGRPLGFLFAWAEFWIIRPSNIGVIASAFGQYAHAMTPGVTIPRIELYYTCAVIAALTIVNVVGARTSKWTQNALTAIKVIGLVAICAIGLLFGGKSESSLSTAPPAKAAATEPTPEPPTATSPATDYRLALILILFTYGGWNEISYAAAEVRDPSRNLWRALIVSAALVTAIYCLLNASFVHALGFQNLQGSKAVAADVMSLALGRFGQTAISILICLSCLAAVNGMIFTGARVAYALGRDHSTFAWLGRWNPQLGSPTRATVLQGIVTLTLVVAFSLRGKGFEQLVNFSAPVFWFFISLVALSIFVLRFRPPPESETPQRVILFPITPILFWASCVFMFYSSVTYAISNRSVEALFVPLVMGVGLIAIVANSIKRSRSQEPA